MTSNIIITQYIIYIIIYINEKLIIDHNLTIFVLFWCTRAQEESWNEHGRLYNLLDEWGGIGWVESGCEDECLMVASSFCQCYYHNLWDNSFFLNQQMPKNEVQRTTIKKMKHSVPSVFTVIGLSIILFVCGWLININIDMH